MNFISQSLGSLTSGAKIYIAFQCLYLAGALFFTYIQIQILKELRKNPSVHTCACEKKF
jgi:hypothetical protein